MAQPSALRIALGFILPTTLIGSCLTMVPRMSGFEKPSLDLVNQCPRATQMLGGKATRRWLSLSHGSSSSDDGTDWTFGVRGLSASGTLRVVERPGQDGFIQYAVLETEKGSIEVVSCQPGTRPLPIPRVALRGSIIDATGPSPHKVGARCEGEIGPGQPGDFPCRLVLSCEGRTLYGTTPTNGYLSCRMEGAGLRAYDGNPSKDYGNDPGITLDAGLRTLSVGDIGALGEWRFVIRLEDPPPG